MEVHFTPEQETKLGQIAARLGTDPERLVRKLAEEWLAVSMVEGSKFSSDLQGVAKDALSAPAEDESKRKAQAAAERIREIRQNTKPDPEGWTVKDYINYGRR